jgi:hypothetical protein
MNIVNIKDMWCLSIVRWRKTRCSVVCMSQLYSYPYGHSIPQEMLYNLEFRPITAVLYVTHITAVIRVMNTKQNVIVKLEISVQKSNFIAFDVF